MNPPEKAESPAAAWAGEVLQAEDAENPSEKNWLDFNDVPVTIADQTKRVREFLGKLRKSIDWSDDEIDMERKGIIHYVENAIDQLEELGLDSKAYSGQFLAFSIGELSMALQLWDRQSASQWARSMRRKRKEKDDIIIKEFIAAAANSWRKGDTRFHNKMAEDLTEQYNSYFAEEIKGGMRHKFKKSTIMNNREFKSLALHHGRLRGVKK